MWILKFIEHRVADRRKGLRSVITSESVITSLAGCEVTFPSVAGFWFSQLVLGRSWGR